MQKTGGYACHPYYHDHHSIEVKDMWTASPYIKSMFFVTATFSKSCEPYFGCSNHYLLARFDSAQATVDGMRPHIRDNESFVFSIHDDFFEREAGGTMNFVSVYYLEYGEDNEDIYEIANLLAKREMVTRAGVGSMDTYCTSSPRFAFPYSNRIVILEVSGDKSHQRVNKYCEKTSSDVSRRGYSLTNMVGLSILERLK